MRAQPLVLLIVCTTGVLAALYAVHSRRLSRPPFLHRGERTVDASTIRALSLAVGDSQAEHAAAARQSLLELIAATQLDPTPQAARRLIELAELLAEQSSAWHESTRAANAELATKMLGAAGDHFPAETRDELIAHSEIILRVAHQGEIARRETTLRRLPSATAKRSAHGAPSERPIAAVNFDAPLAQFPGGGLPIERAGPAVPEPVAETPPLNTTTGSVAGGSVAQSGTPLLINASEAAPRADGAAPLPLTAASPQLRDMPRFQRDAANRQRNSVAAAAAVVAVRDASQGSARPTSPVIEMAQRLHSPVDTTRVEARAELRAIGYSAAHVELLRSVTDADAEKRAAAARALPVMRGMNARPWLLWLSYDDAEEVRHAALSVLGTSYDPALMDRMREAANQDAAPRVRRLAETYLTNMAQRP